MCAILCRRTLTERLRPKQPAPLNRRPADRWRAACCLCRWWCSLATALHHAAYRSRPFAPRPPVAQCAGRRWAVGLCPSSPALQPDGEGAFDAPFRSRPGDLSLSRFGGHVRAWLRASLAPAGLLPFRPASSLVGCPPLPEWCVRRVPSGSGAAWARRSAAPECIAALPLARYAIPARPLQSRRV